MKGTLIILSPGFPSNEADTTCLPAQQLFVRSVNRIFPDIRIKIISLQYPYRRDHYKWFQNDVISLNLKGVSLLFRGFAWISAYRMLKKIGKAENMIGILSFWCSETALIGNFFAKRNGIRHKIWILGQDARKTNQFVNWINPQPNNLVALSQFLVGEFHRNHSIRPMHLVKNGVDREMFGQQVHDRSIDIIGVGSLIPLKRYDIFIEVVKSLADDFPHIKVVLIGEGPEKKVLQESTLHAGLQKNILFKGELPHKDAIDSMQKAKILLHPSVYEGYSTVCMEALYAGCHVVSFTSAEEQPVDHWHVVATPEEMAAKCRELLNSETDFAQVMINTMDESARSMIDLYR